MLGDHKPAISIVDLLSSSPRPRCIFSQLMLPRHEVHFAWDCWEYCGLTLFLWGCLHLLKMNRFIWAEKRHSHKASSAGRANYAGFERVHPVSWLFLNNLLAMHVAIMIVEFAVSAISCENPACRPELTHRRTDMNIWRLNYSKSTDCWPLMKSSYTVVEAIYFLKNASFWCKRRLCPQQNSNGNIAKMYSKYGLLTFQEWKISVFKCVAFLG